MQLALAGGFAVLVAVAARVPLLGLPLTTDEGGYAEVARLWARGATLYDDVWVDRPQGLILVFRGLLHMGDPVLAMRIAALAAAAALALLVMAIGVRVAGVRAGVAAGLLAAAAGGSPFFEAFTLSGELLAAVPAALSILAFAVYVDARRARWLVLAGLAAGCGLMLKQSALDPVLAIAGVLVWTRRRAALRPVALFGSAVAAPIVLCALSATSVGAWWYAVAGYRQDGDSLLTGGLDYRLTLLLFSLPALVYGLLFPAVAGALGWRASPLVVRLWIVGAAVGVLGGGNFHPHYYTQLIAPLAIAAGVFVDRLLAAGVARRPLAATAFAAAAAVALATNVPVYFQDREQQVETIYHRSRLLVHEWSARYVADHATVADRVLVIPEGPNVHYAADRDPVLPYLWAANVRTIPGALGLARAAVERREARLVVLVRPASVLDSSGRLGESLRRNYRTVARRGSARVLVRRPPTGSPTSRMVRFSPSGGGGTS